MRNHEIAILDLYLAKPQSRKEGKKELFI